MLITRELSSSGDPSDTAQEFKKLDINILCCRYWWFDIWKGKEMSFPFWRLYWNKNEGAYVYFKKKIFLSPDKLYLIPPNTAFSNGISDQSLKGDPDYFFKCGRIHSKESENAQLKSGSILHFFIHFTLGNDYEGGEPGIYEIDMDIQKKDILEEIVSFLLKDGQQFNRPVSMQLYKLLVLLLSELPDTVWTKDNLDRRIREALLFMEREKHTKLTDRTIAEKVNMGTSTFVRLFKNNLRYSPSRFLLDLRLKHAAEMLSHTDLSIEDIAQKCGFTDRYHLTRLFPKKYGTTPAAFRKRMGYY